MTTDPLAQAVMVAYCGWDPTVEATDTTVVLDGDGTAWAFLPCLNVTAVSAVSVTNWDGTTYTPTIGPGNDVGWTAAGILTWQSCNNGAAWPGEAGSITVTYSNSWGSGQDQDLIAAALASLSKRTSTGSGATSKKIGTAAITYAPTIAEGGMLLVEQMVFDRYRLPKAA